MQQQISMDFVEKNLMIKIIFLLLHFSTWYICYYVGQFNGIHEKEEKQCIQKSNEVQGTD